MSLPKEGSRDVQDGIIVSIVPDICLTPAGSGMVPVPYTIWCRQADAANLANSVRQTNDRSHAVASIVVRCYGDEPGIGGGIFSGTTGAECTPKTWSSSVRAEGRNMVRHEDEWWMNHRNTYGRLTYTKDMNYYEVPEPNWITPQIRTSSKTDTLENVASDPQIHQLSQADATGADGGVCEIPESPFWQGIHLGMALLGIPHVRVTAQENRQCPPCRTASRTVPVGTLAYRHDLVPPSKPHYPFSGDHYNMYRANQYPYPKCDCFWQYIGTEDASGGKPPPPGSIPIEPFVR